MNTQQLNGLNRVLEKIREITEKSADGDYIYRGEPEEYKEPPYYGRISSSLYREYPHVEGELFDIVSAQNAILEEAKAYTAKTDSVEILSELQHFGGKTNLIDFTADYLIALFFACDGAHEKCGRVILLEKESEDYAVGRPPKTINRVESQKSVFVQSPKGFIEPDDVVIVPIPAGLKLPMLNYLQKYHNISTETIYNDLHGFIRIQDIHHKAYEAFYRGFSAMDKGDFDKAIKDFTTAIEIKPDFFGAYNNRGNAYSRKGDFDKAIQDLTTAIEIKPDYAEAYYNRGIDYVEKHDFDTAIQDFTTTIEIKPDYATAYYCRGIAYGEKRDFDTAIQNYDTAIKIKPDYATAYCNRGVAYVEKRDFDTAIQNYDTAIKIKPDFAEAYHGRGVAYVEKRDFDKAIQDFTAAIELKPDFAEVYCNRGNAYGAKRDFDTAIQDFTAAIELKPDFAEAYYNRGIAYRRKGDFDKTIQDITTAIEIKPDDAEAYYNRGEAWMHMSEWDKAKADLTVAKDRGVDIINSFQNDYENVADFEQKNGVQVPPDIAEMLTLR